MYGEAIQNKIIQSENDSINAIKKHIGHGCI
jgi:hypothetical protein